MNKKPQPLSRIDLFAPGGLERLFAFHEAQFGDATMTAGPGEPEQKNGGGTQTQEKTKEEEKPKPGPLKQEEQKPEEFEGLNEAGKRALQAERDAAAEERRKRAEAERKLQEKEDAELSELERTKKQLTQKDEDNAKLNEKIMRLTALANHQVPKDYQYLVHGTDEASFEASAKGVAELAAKAEGKAPPPERVQESGSGSGSGNGNNSGGSIAAGRDSYRARHKDKK